MDFILTDNDKKILLRTARETIAAALENREPVLDPSDGILETLCGAFVTLHENGELRGCIGHMTGIEPLFQTVKEMAYAAAFEDPRFPPVTVQELDKLFIEISVLTPLEKTTDPNLIQVGVHGIYLVGKGRAGVLLPQVATEQGWDRETFLRQTCRKAGLPPEAYKDPAITIYLFSAIIFDEKIL
jgi:uncharacterized protein